MRLRNESKVIIIEIKHKCGIYKCTCLGNNKIYIGQSVDIKLRINRHIHELESNKHFNQYMQNSFNKYGKDSFVWDVVEYCEKENLNEREIYWINYYDSFHSGFNANDGGSHNRMYIRTPEHNKIISKITKESWTNERREKQSERMSGEKNPMYGKYGVSNPSYGISRKGVDSYKYGRVHTEEEKEKNRLAHLGINNKMSKPVICEETQTIFYSQGEAGRNMNCDSATINKCCRGIKNTAGGYHWRYATEEEIKLNAKN